MIPLLFFDPGLDCTGWALFDAARWMTPRNPRVRADLERAVNALVTSGQIKSLPGVPMPERLELISQAAEELVLQRPPELVYVERPAYHGDYERGGHARRRGVNDLHMAMGALLAGVSRGMHRLEVRQRVELVHALSGRNSRKEDRHRMLELGERQLGKAGELLPRGPRGGIPQDEWDAIWLGCWCLLSRGGRDLEPRAVTAEPVAV